MALDIVLHIDAPLGKKLTLDFAGTQVLANSLLIGKLPRVINRITPTRLYLTVPILDDVLCYSWLIKTQERRKAEKRDVTLHILGIDYIMLGVIPIESSPAGSLTPTYEFSIDMLQIK